MITRLFGYSIFQGSWQGNEEVMEMVPWKQEALPIREKEDITLEPANPTLNSALAFYC